MTRSRPLLAWLIACYAFLYAPIAFLVALSFNASRLVTAWDGFSLRWYVALWHDQPLVSAATGRFRRLGGGWDSATVLG